jgi:hypothetical protein
LLGARRLRLPRKFWQGHGGDRESCGVGLPPMKQDFVMYCFFLKGCSETLCFDVIKQSFSNPNCSRARHLEGSHLCCCYSEPSAHSQTSPSYQSSELCSGL